MRRKMAARVWTTRRNAWPAMIAGRAARRRTAARFPSPRRPHRDGGGSGRKRQLSGPSRRAQEPHGFRQPAEGRRPVAARSEEHTSELQSLMRTSYAVFCLKKKKQQKEKT